MLRSRFFKHIMNSFWLLLERGLRVLLTIFVNIYVIRYLGPENYGTLSYVIAIITILTVWTEAVANDTLIKAVIDKPKETQAYLGSAFLLRSLCLAISGLLLFCYAILDWIKGSSDAIYYFILIINLIPQVFRILLPFLQAKLDSFYGTLASFMGAFITSVYRIILVYYEASLVWFFVAFVIEGLVIAIFLIGSFKKIHLDYFPWQIERSKVKELFLTSLPLVIINFLVAFIGYIDRFIIGSLTSVKLVGQYAAGLKFVEVCYIIPYAILLGLFPALLRGKAMGEESYQKRLQQLANFLVLVSVFLQIVFFFGAEFIITIFIGEDFLESASILQYYSFNLGFIFLILLFYRWLVACDSQRYGVATVSAGALVNVCLNLLLIPYLSIKGAALASIGTNVSMLLLCSVIPVTRPFFKICLQAYINVLLFRWIIDVKDIWTEYIRKELKFLQKNES